MFSERQGVLIEETIALSFELQVFLLYWMTITNFIKHQALDLPKHHVKVVNKNEYFSKEPHSHSTHTNIEQPKVNRD
jgi:signal transduction histidine kinase